MMKKGENFLLVEETLNIDFRNHSFTSAKLHSVFTYLDHYTIFRPLTKQGMAGSLLPGMSGWYPKGLLIRLHGKLA